MKKWPWQRRFGFYAALLSVVVWMLGILAICPLVNRHQLEDLDRELHDNAQEIIRDIQNFSGAPANYLRTPIADRFISPSLRRRLLHILGPEGQVLKKSPNLKTADLSTLDLGYHTIVLEDRECRIGSFKIGYLTVHIGTRLGILESTQADIMRAIWYVIPGLSGVVFLSGWWLAKRALVPIHNITQAAQYIQAGHETQRIPQPEAKDAIFALAEVLNATFDRLQTSYEAAARFSADASHQLKTPLAVLRAGLDALGQNERLTQDDQEEIGQLRKQTRRLTALVNDLLMLAQLDAGRLAMERQTVDLRHLILAAVDDAEILCELRGITLTTTIPDQLTAAGDEKRIPIILQNLLENAVKYSLEEGWIKVTTEQDASQIRVTVANSGNPIPLEAQEHLFERFYRGKVGESISGHGLGLNISAHLAKAQGGGLRLLRSDAAGTVFEFWLPAKTAS